MCREIVLAPLIAAALFVAMPAGAQQRDAFDQAFEAVDRQMDEAMAAVEAQWNAMVAAEEARWAKLQAEVEAKWDSFVASSEKEWVDYSDDRDVRARVDYEQGRVVIEVLIPVQAAAPLRKEEPVQAPPREEPAKSPPEEEAREAPPKAEPVKGPLREEPPKAPPREEAVSAALPPAAVAKIAAEVQKIARPAPEAVIGPVEAQVKTAQGAPLTEQNAKEFVEKELAPKVVVEPQVIVGKDGVKRRKAQVVVPMVPEHLYVRAAKFKESVERESAKYDLDPRLVFAVIHTESYFNPRARSPAMAFGLMQLIPKYGAFEAIEFIEGKGRLVEPDYLYVPENNVTLGAAYLHLLHTRYYGKVEDPEKRELLVVASYNWGPTAVRRNIVDRNPVATLTPEQLRAVVDQRAPQETKDYVVRVSTRKPIYDGLVTAAGGAR